VRAEDSAYNLSIDPAYWSDEDVGETLSGVARRRWLSSCRGWLTFSNPVSRVNRPVRRKGDAGVLNVRVDCQ
jgi:hypothetical protein